MHPHGIDGAAALRTVDELIHVRSIGQELASPDLCDGVVSVLLARRAGRQLARRAGQLGGQERGRQVAYLLLWRSRLFVVWEFYPALFGGRLAA